MNKLFVFVMLLIVSSCVSTVSKVEKAAVMQVQTTLTELAKDPTSVKFEDIHTVYIDDSLCVLQMTCKAKNGFGHEISDQIEYYYIGSNGKFYEAYQDFSGDGAIFCTPEQYNKQKNGKIYKDLSYAEGLRYLVALFTNTSGREVGSSESESVSIPVPTGTGLWDLKAYTDTPHVVNTKPLPFLLL